MGAVDESRQADFEAKTAAAQARRQDHPSTTGGGGGTYDGMETRVAKLESDMTDIKVLLGRIDERLIAMSAVMVTKSDLADVENRLSDRIGRVESRVSHIEGALEAKMSTSQFVQYGTGLAALSVAAITLLLKWPIISTFFTATP